MMYLPEQNSVSFNKTAGAGAPPPAGKVTGPVEPQPLPSRYTIQVLAKALDLLEALGQARAGLTLAELSRRLELPKSSVFRYLATLEARGYVEKVPETDRYRLGLRLFEIGNLVASHFDVTEFALPFMRKLVETFRETVNLAVLYQGEVVYLQILESTRSMRMSAQPGQRNLCHSTALGKALLAYLPESERQAIVAQHGLPALTPRTITTVEQLQEELARVRHRGYAIDDIENEEGVRCVAAPIFNYRGEPIAAISISGPADRMPYGQMELMGKELLAGTRAISRRLGYRD